MVRQPRFTTHGRVHYDDPVSTVSATTSIAKLAPLFAAYAHHHIPVLDTQEKLAGMIT
jgi:CBS-domain-containing membrane protein